MPRSLPDRPNLEWLRKRAKRRLETLKRRNPDASLASAQLDLAREYGFASWRALKTHIDSLTTDGRLLDATEKGDVAVLTSLLDAYPDRLLYRYPPYERTLLHAAAQHGHTAAVNLLLGGIL